MAYAAVPKLLPVRQPFPPPPRPGPGLAPIAPQVGAVRKTLFFKTNVGGSIGWRPAAVIEVNDPKMATTIAMRSGGALGPVGASVPNEFF